MAGTYLDRTIGTATDGKKFTISCWAKYSSNNGGNANHLITATPNPGSWASVRLLLNQLELVIDNETYYIRTNAILRDVSAWYHIVVKYDSTQATASDRMIIYINGIAQSYSQSNYVPLNHTTNFSANGQTLRIGHNVWATGGNEWWNGLFSQFIFCDGYAYTASTFGSIDATTGIWKCNGQPSVTFGNQGFWLKFENSGSLGTDSSGNGNNFTVTSGTPTQTVDTPSNVFATLNPLDKSSTITLSNGNLTSVMGGGGFYDVKSTLGMEANSGKWYFEAKSPSISSGGVLGVVLMEKDGSNHGAVDAGRIVYQNNGNIYREGLGLSAITGYATWTTGDVMSLALDTTTAGQNLKFYKNNTLIHTETNSAFSSNTWCFYVAGNGVTWDINYGNGRFGTTAISSPYSDGAGLGKFQYQPPTGYYALCTKNINVYG